VLACHATSAGSSISRRILPLPGLAECSGQYKRSAAIFRLQPCRRQWCLTAFKHTEVDGVDKTDGRSKASISRYVDAVGMLTGGAREGKSAHLTTHDGRALGQGRT